MVDNFQNLVYLVVINMPSDEELAAVGLEIERQKQNVVKLHRVLAQV